MFQISNTPAGYVVEYYDRFGPDSLLGHWKPLRNFGDRQGDARACMEIDCPHLDTDKIRFLIRHYDPARKYIRVSANRYKRTAE